MFRDFVRNDMNNIKLEARGRSYGGQWSLPTTQGIAFFLSMIEGEPQRIRALRWIQTDGLMLASKGRDVIADSINQKLSQNDDIAGTLAPKVGVNPSGKVAGMREVREPWEVTQKAERWEGGVHPSDIFSPIAREGHPMNQFGSWADSEFLQKYEPRFMEFQTGSGHYLKINIESINTHLEQKGLPTFHYGGVDGYLQYIEKGDWLPEDDPRRRSQADPNQQHGPDLSEPETEYDKKGNPIVHFTGGAVGKKEDNYRNAIRAMSGSFTQAAEIVSNTQSVEHLPPELQKPLANLIMVTRELKRAEHAPSPRRGISKQILDIGQRAGKKPVSFDDMDDTALELFYNAMETGLRTPITLSGSEPFKQLEAEEAIKADFIKSYRKISDGKWEMVLGDKGVASVWEHVLKKDPVITPSWRWKQLFKVI